MRAIENTKKEKQRRSEEQVGTLERKWWQAESERRGKEVDSGDPLAALYKYKYANTNTKTKQKSIRLQGLIYPDKIAYMYIYKHKYKCQEEILLAALSRPPGRI